MKKIKKSDKQYREVSFQKVVCGSAWLRIPFAFFGFLSDAEAKMLAYLLDVHTEWDSRPEYKKRNGWYFHTQKKLLRVLKIPVATQHRVLTKLIGKGLLEMKRDGPFRRRYLRLNAPKIACMIDLHSGPVGVGDVEEEPEDEGPGG